MQRWDVFVSYTHEDEAWVRALADNLHRAAETCSSIGGRWSGETGCRSGCSRGWNRRRSWCW